MQNLAINNLMLTDYIKAWRENTDALNDLLAIKRMLLNVPDSVVSEVNKALDVKVHPAEVHQKIKDIIENAGVSVTRITIPKSAIKLPDIQTSSPAPRSFPTRLGAAPDANGNTQAQTAATHSVPSVSVSSVSNSSPAPASSVTSGNTTSMPHATLHPQSKFQKFWGWLGEPLPFVDRWFDAPRWTGILVGLLIVLFIILILVVPKMINRPVASQPNGTGNQPLVIQPTAKRQATQVPQSGTNKVTATPKVPTTVAPQAPSRSESVDAGSTSWLAAPQKLQKLIPWGLILGILVDLIQKVRKGIDKKNNKVPITGEDRRKSLPKWQAVVAGVFAFLTVFTVFFGGKLLILSLPDLVLKTAAIIAFMFAVVFLVVASLLASFDLSMAGGIVGFVAVEYMISADKGIGILSSVFGFTKDSVLYNMDGLGRLNDLKQYQEAIFSNVIYWMLSIAAILIIADLVMGILRRRLWSIIGIIAGFAIGGTWYALGRWNDRYSQAIAALVALGILFVNAAFDLDDIDEAWSLGMVFGSFCLLAFTLPLPPL
jgi:tetrahydromethanopterin S-methyltransferase subunit D